MTTSATTVRMVPSVPAGKATSFKLMGERVKIMMSVLDQRTAVLTSVTTIQVDTHVDADLDFF